MWIKFFEKSLTPKLGKHIPCRFSMSKIWMFDFIENKYDLYRGECCMKEFS